MIRCRNIAIVMFFFFRCLVYREEKLMTAAARCWVRWARRWQLCAHVPSKTSRAVRQKFIASFNLQCVRGNFIKPLENMSIREITEEVSRFAFLPVSEQLPAPFPSQGTRIKHFSCRLCSFDSPTYPVTLSRDYSYHIIKKTPFSCQFSLSSPQIHKKS